MKIRCLSSGIEKTIFSSKWYGLLGFRWAARKKNVSNISLLVICLNDLLPQPSYSMEWRCKKASQLRSKEIWTRTILLHYYQIIGISIYSLLMTGGREERCAVGWAPKDPLSVFSPPCLSMRPRKIPEKKGRKNIEKHNFKISQLDQKMRRKKMMFKRAESDFRAVQNKQKCKRSSC